MFERIDHTAISVPDMDEALVFYGEVMGFEIRFSGAWPKGTQLVDTLIGLEESSARMAILELGGTRLELFEFESPEPDPRDRERPVQNHGYTHICLEVSGIDEEYERLKEAGVRFRSAPIDIGAGRCVYGRDPFGNTFELIEPPDG